MVMKDKLYKSHHKGIYYKTRKALITSAVVFGAFVAVSVPTYINIKNVSKVKHEVLREHVEIAHENENVDVTKMVATKGIIEAVDDSKPTDKWYVSQDAI